MAKSYFKHSSDRDDPRYKAWSYAVKCLYDFTCALCKRKSDKFTHLESHHIIRWADNEKLRFKVSNGCCLCQECHKLVTGREEQYADVFRKMTIQKIKEQRATKKKVYKQKYREAARKQNKFVGRNDKVKKWRPNPKSGY